MKKTISTILTLTVLAVTLSGSNCFANDPKTTTANSQYIPNQSRKKEFQFGKLLNKNKWGKIALGATAGITALAGATIAGLEVLRAKSYSTSNDTCKFSIDGIAQELKHGTCDNMFKYAVSHLKSFNNVAKSCSVNVNGTSKLPEDKDINNLINFANHYHLNLDEAAKAFTVKDETNNSVSFVPYDIMCKSAEFSKRFNTSLANAASAINKLGYKQAQEYAEAAKKNNLPLSDVIKVFQINEKIQLFQQRGYNLSDYLNIAKKYDLPLDFINNLIKSSTIIDEYGNVSPVPSAKFSQYITLCTNFGLSLSDMTNYAQLLQAKGCYYETVAKLAGFAKSNNLSFNDIKSFVNGSITGTYCSLLIEDLNLFSKYAQKYNSSLNDFLNIFRFKDEKGNTVLHNHSLILEAAKAANDYDLPFNSLTNCVKAWTESGKPMPRNFIKYIFITKKLNVSPNDLKKVFELGLDSKMNTTQLYKYLKYADENKVDKLKLIKTLLNSHFFGIENAMEYAQENKLDVFKVIETASHFEEQHSYLNLYRFLDSKFKNTKGSADIPTL